MTEIKNDSNNEIDLLDLLVRLGRELKLLFISFFNALIFLFVFGIRRLHWLMVFALLGGSFGALFYKTGDHFFTSEMIAQPNGFSSADMKVYINDVHEMCLKGNSAGIALVLELPEDIAKNIKDIEAFLYIDVNKDGIGDFVDFKNTFNPTDTTQSIISNRILIRAQVYDNSAFNEVKVGIQQYINNNAYLVAVNNLRKDELQSLINQSISEIQKLDSLQNYEYYKSPSQSKLNREGQIVFMNEKQTQLYYRDKISLLSTKLQYQRSLELATTPITTIKDFAELEMEENPITKYIILFGFFGGLAGFVFLLIYKYWALVKGFLNKYN